MFCRRARLTNHAVIGAMKGTHHCITIRSGCQAFQSFNGKVRSKLTLPAGTSDKDIETAALADPKVKEHLAGKTPKKVIVVQGKLVSVVI